MFTNRHAVVRRLPSLLLLLLCCFALACTGLPPVEAAPRTPSAPLPLTPSGRSGTNAAASDDELPPPPDDAAGGPSTSTIVRSDQLLLSSRSGDNNPVDRFVEPTATLDEEASASAFVSRPGWRRDLNEDYPTAAGRFRDPLNDRALALRHVRAGDESLWQLGTTDDYQLPVGHRQQGPLQSDDPADFSGRTFALVPDSDDESAVTADVSSGRGSALRSSTHGDLPEQQWTFVPAARAGADGWYQLVSKADGLCLDVPNGSYEAGTQLATWDCQPQDTDNDNQLWRPIRSGDGWFLQNRRSRLVLSQSEDTYIQAKATISETTRFQAYQYEPRGGDLPTWSEVTSVGAEAPFDLAVGDLDRRLGRDGLYHDEAAVVFADDDHHLQVRVMDYDATPGRATVYQPSTPMAYDLGVSTSGTWFPGSLGAAIGDFDDDARNELAVTFQNSTGFHVAMLELNITKGAPSLDVRMKDAHLLDSTTVLRVSPVAGYSDLVAGDFDGSGRDQLALSYAASVAGIGQAYVSITSFDDSLRPAVSGRRVMSIDSEIARGQKDIYYQNEPQPITELAPLPSGTTWTQRGIKLAAGLFKVDPSTGFDLHRRQLAVAWLDSVTGDSGGNWTTYEKTAVQILTSTLDTEDGPRYDLSPVTAQLYVNRDNTGKNRNRPAWANIPFALTAGGLSGPGDDDIQPWGLAVGFSGRDVLGKQAGSRVQLLRVDDGEKLVATTTFDRGSDINRAWHLTAYDRTGTSMVLGAPVVIRTTALNQTNLIAAQPPAHADWRPDLDPDEKFLNVSRNPELNVELEQNSGTQYASSTTTGTDYELGGSQETEVNSKVEADLHGILEGEVSAGFKQKLAYKYDHDAKDLKSHDHTETFSTTETGTDDDVVDALLVTSYVYRYPILGGDLKKPDGSNYTNPDCPTRCQGYYEVHVPGTEDKVHGFGRDYDWYQPAWQNGNVLSYPTLAGGKVPTPDLGSYSYVDANGKTVTPAPKALFNSRNTLGGGETKASLALEDKTLAGKELTSKHTVTGGLDTSVGAKGDFKFGPFASWETDVQETIGTEDGSTWSSLTTGETTTTTGSAFTLNVPQIPQNQSYGIGTAYYHDRSGGVRVSHAVDLQASDAGSQWWRTYYGQAPDPALNLPDSTVTVKNALGVYDDLRWSAEATRQKIRGFSVVDESGRPVTETPTAGDKVRFQVRVNNFSLKASPKVPVQFWAVPVAADKVKVTGAATKIGDLQESDALGPQASTVVTSPVWTAASSDSQQHWRIFAVLDPDDKIGEEIHELRGEEPCEAEFVTNRAVLKDPMKQADEKERSADDETLACGQNNQGYGEVTVMSRPLPGAPRRSGTIDVEGVTLQRSGTTQPSSTFAVGDQVHGLIRAGSEQDTTEHRRVLVFDGDPQQGNLIAATTVQGVSSEEGGAATFDWQPTGAGAHALHVVLLGSSDDRDEHVVKVTVTEPRASCRTAADLPGLVTELDAPKAKERQLVAAARRAARARGASQAQHLRVLLKLVRSGTGTSFDRSNGEALQRVIKQVLHTRCSTKPRRVTMIRLSPAATTERLGRPHAYTATGYDARGREVGDVTTQTRFAIRRGGSCTRNRCRSAVLGDHVVTGTYRGLRSTAVLTVRRS